MHHKQTCAKSSNRTESYACVNICICKRNTAHSGWLCPLPPPPPPWGPPVCCTRLAPNEKTMCAMVATNQFHSQKPHLKVLKYNSIHFEFHKTNNYTHFRFRGSTLPNAIVGSCKYQGRDVWQTRPSAEYWALPPALQNTPHHRTSSR